jgi:hypothetical protein
VIGRGGVGEGALRIGEGRHVLRREKLGGREGRYERGNRLGVGEALDSGEFVVSEEVL